MLKELFQSVCEYAAKAQELQSFECNGRTYLNRSAVEVAWPSPAALKFKTLSALLEYFDKNKATDQDAHMAFFRPVEPNLVKLQSPLMGDENQRHTYAIAEFDTQIFRFGEWMDQEEFTIQAMARIIATPDLTRLLKLVGALKSGSSRTSEDDGVTQVVSTRKGVSMTSTEKVDNPFLLAPMRTFSEITQPTSPFILRVRMFEDKNPMVALFEADGGAWKVQAINSIAAFLRADKRSEGGQVYA